MFCFSYWSRSVCVLVPADDVLVSCGQEAGPENPSHVL